MRRLSPISTCFPSAAKVVLGLGFTIAWVASSRSHAAEFRLAYSIEGPLAGVPIGFAVGAVYGDVDADGIPDFLTGGFGSSGGALPRGFLVSGQAGTLLLEVPASDIIPAMSGVGDLDGDGIPDWAIASFIVLGPLGNATNVVEVYSGATGTPPPGQGALFYAVAGDGSPGLAGGKGRVVYGSNENGVGGRVLVLQSHLGAVQAELWGETPGSLLGAPCANVGDYNGDGVDDYAVVDPSVAVPGGRGRIYVINGAVTTAAPTPITSLATSDLLLTVDAPSGASFPTSYGSIVRAGDQTGDGTPDLLVAIRSVVLFDIARDPGGGLSATPLRSVSSFLAFACAPIGDLDEDGFFDFAVGDAVTPQWNPIHGLILLSGRTLEQIEHVPDPQEPPAGPSYFGKGLAAIGDLEGDGRINVAVGAPLYISPTLGGLTGAVLVYNAGWRTRAGDLDGDGDVDLADFLQFQLCFTGSNNPLAPECLVADLDGDGDVDLADFLVFQQNFTGSR